MLAETVLVCRIVSGSVSVAPCADLGGASYAPVMVAADLLQPGDGAALAAWGTPVDWASIAPFFAFSFSMVVGVWFASWAIGSIVRAFR